jgi:hypothetical protein
LSLEIFLAEIVQQELPPAHGRLGLSLRFLQQLAPDLLLGLPLVVSKLLQFLQVTGRVERDAVALAPVSSGSSGLLIEALKALGMS